MDQTYPEPMKAGEIDPAYVPVITFLTGAKIASSTDEFFPRKQSDKLAMYSVEEAKDIARAAGPIAPDQPYPVASDDPLEPPVATAIDPATAVAGGPALIATITGTGFSAWTTVETGGVPTDYVQVISDTEIRIGIDAHRSVAGTIDIVVIDHGEASAPVTFTFTEAAP